VIIDQQYKNVYRLSTHDIEGGDKFPVSTEAIGDIDFWAVFLEATEKTQRPFCFVLSRILTQRHALES